MRNYVVVNPAGRAVAWFEDGNDAIAYRDQIDKAAHRPRFSSAMLTSGQWNNKPKGWKP